LDGTLSTIPLSKQYIIVTQDKIIKKEYMEELPQIPEHHSAVRHMVSETNDISYQPLRDFDEAKRTGDAVVVMEGDWGGQIYLVCPISLEAVRKLVGTKEPFE
jgi:hypothetical protein